MHYNAYKGFISLIKHWLSIDQLVILVAVDNSQPQVFITDSDEWHDELKSVIYENRQRVRQGT